MKALVTLYSGRSAVAISKEESPLPKCWTAGATSKRERQFSLVFVDWDLGGAPERDQARACVRVIQDQRFIAGFVGLLALHCYTFLLLLVQVVIAVAFGH